MQKIYPGLDYHENYVEEASCFMLGSKSNTGKPLHLPSPLASFRLCKDSNNSTSFLASCVFWHLSTSFIFLVIFQQKSSSWDLILCFFYTLSWIFNRAGTKCVVPVSSYVQFCPKLLDGNVANTFSTLLQIIWTAAKKTFFKGQLLNIVMFCLDDVKWEREKENRTPVLHIYTMYIQTVSPQRLVKPFPGQLVGGGYSSSI